MNEKKSSLLVFEKKEVALIFLLMVVAVFTAFILGVKLGKTYTMSKEGYVPTDTKVVDLKSQQEEQVEKATKGDVHVDTMDKSFNKLEEEFNKLDSNSSKKPEESAHGATTESKPAAAVDGHGDAHQDVKKNTELAQDQKSRASDQYKGKYTIQLGSHKTLDEAQKFADGFRIRGYDPIISEVEIRGRGMWFRVSLGAFKSLQEAKDFLVKEKTLFHGQDYVIGRFE